MMNFPFDAALPGPVAQLVIGGNLVNMDHTAHMAEGNGHDEMAQGGY